MDSSNSADTSSTRPHPSTRMPLKDRQCDAYSVMTKWIKNAWALIFPMNRVTGFDSSLVSRPLLAANSITQRAARGM